ncbi:TPA: hypothetical protein QB352_000169 [Pasteurella multocida]|nr:hypothetical protein [Pasteurella multocida]
MTVQFNKEGFALETGEVVVYVTDEKGIYTHTVTEFVVEGTGISAGSYLEQVPKVKSGYAIKRVENGWKYIEDHRGEIVYSTIDKTEITINDVGAYPENTTKLKPPCSYCEWNGEKWFISQEKQTEAKRQLIQKLVDNIDNTAASILSKWTRFTEEYKLREVAAIEFKEANFTGEVSIYISSFATVSGLDNKSATLLILKQAEGLRTLQEQLAVQRMRKYELKHEELADEELQRIHDDIISKMQTLAEVQQ